jgi:leucyl aminopeptidase
VLRRRSKQSESLQDRLMKFAKEAREKASRLPPGSEREDMLRKARQADTASHMNDWINSLELQSPK